jgi:hypothetical protein
VEDIDFCHVLFVASSEAERVERILAALRARHVLTVSDLDNFSSVGGMVRFVTDSGKIRLRINVEATKAAGLTLSSKVLRPAQIVTATTP